jgi:acyl carrier protein
LRSGFHGPLPVLYRFGGLIMTIASLKWSQKATATREVLASNDARTLIANQLGVDVKRVTDEAHFTDDLGADWLDRLELMIAIEDRFADVVITDEDVWRMKVQRAWLKARSAQFGITLRGSSRRNPPASRSSGSSLHGPAARAPRAATRLPRRRAA